LWSLITIRSARRGSCASHSISSIKNR
jgi:hypothetical protein